MRAPLLWAGMQKQRVRHWHPVDRLTARPADAQQKVLERLLTANQNTDFGTEHGFRRIRDVADFQARVPVQTYETLRGYIDEQRRKGRPALTAEQPLFYAQTSGTTGAPKYLPVTSSVLALQRTEQALFSYLQYRACPGGFRGKALGIMGAAEEGRLDSGHPVGSISGYLYRSLPHAVQSRFVVPPNVSCITDYNLKYLVILRLALAEPDISYLGSPNPTTFVRLLEILNERRDALIRSLETGRLGPLEDVEEPLRREIAERLRPEPGTARRLRAIPNLTFANVWPNIRLVTTWMGGSCGIALESLRDTLPAGTRVMELGYQSTECRVTLPLEAETTGGLPTLHHHFLEFVEQTRWDNGEPDYLSLDRLEAGRRYYVLVTTPAGLYRYFMNDLVEVAGFYRRTPLLRFLQKGKGVTNLTGEKLYETQVIEAVRDAFARHGVIAGFYVVVADEARSAYRLYCEARPARHEMAEAIVADIDRHLGECNIEYHAKRASGRLGPMTLGWLRPGTGEAHKAACIRAGQREGQFKPALLQYRAALPLPIDEYLLDRTHVADTVR